MCGATQRGQEHGAVDWRSRGWGGSAASVLSLDARGAGVRRHLRARIEARAGRRRRASVARLPTTQNVHSARVLGAWRCITVCETNRAHAVVAVGGSNRKRRRTALSLLSEHLLARPQSQKRARSPYLHGRDMVGVATGASFRRGERAFLSGHYFAAEVTSPAGDGWGRRRSHHRCDLMLKCRNFCLRYGPRVRSQWRILSGNRLLQILDLLTHIGDFLVDISRHRAALWL
jgi:hypothetical protein